MAFTLETLVEIAEKSADKGTLVDLVETSIHLIEIVLPLVDDPEVQADLQQTAQTLTTYRPAEPTAPEMGRVSTPKQGGK